MVPTVAQRHSHLSTHLVAASDADFKRAETLMLEYQQGISKRVGDEFCYKDANGVLERIAQGIIVDATPALVQALLEYNASVSVQRFKSTSLWKMMLRKDQSDIRSHVLEQAVRNCPDATVLCLAQNADSTSINDALPIAINLGDSLKAYILLQHGADASRLCQAFLKAVDDGPDDMVETLVTQGKGVCQDCRNRGLVQAATLGHDLKARVLLNNGADVTFNHASALLSATRAGWHAIAEDIASRQQMRQYPLLLDSAVGEAYDQKQYNILLLLLDAGAKGPRMDAVLVKAIESNQLELAQALVRQGAMMSGEGDNWLLSAVKSGRPELLQIALQSKPSHDLLAAAIPHAAKLSSLQVCHQMITLLLAAGVRGDSVCDTLIQVLNKTLQPSEERMQQDLINLLLKQGQADINLRGGRCLALVVTQGRTDLLALFLRYRPSIESLVVALGSAMDLAIPDLRSEIIQIILHDKTGSIGNDETRRERLHQAAISAAAKSLRLEVLNSLISPTTAQATFSAALSTLISGNHKWLTYEGLPVVQALLERGASGPSIDDGFCQAVRACEQAAIELMANFVGDSAFDRALMELVNHSAAWKSPDQLWLIELLLQRVSQDQTVNEFFLEAASACAEGKASQDLVDTVFGVCESVVDVNYKHGEPLKRAIRGGHEAAVPLLKLLVESGASSESVAQAFLTIITTTLKEDTTLALLEVLVDYAKATSTSLNVKVTSPEGFPSLVACLASHPSSPKLLKRLIELGCDTETAFWFRMDSEKGAEPETVTVLLWALYWYGEYQISTDVIAVLIEANANVDIVASRSRVTPLILASQRHRSDVVGILVKAKANHNSRDQFNKSALYYASQAGDADTVQHLAKGSRPNDGSLHEAARNLRSKAAEILIKYKHEAIFPSPEHEGRTPLQELAFLCDGPRDPAELEATLYALEKGKANVLGQYDGRNALFLALENAQPYYVTAALLRTIMWREINSEENIYCLHDKTTRTKFYFSPTMYLQKGCFAGDPAHITKLLDLLHQMQSVDRYYAEPGPDEIKFAQPDDAVGLPKRLQEAEDRRKAEAEKQMYKEEDHLNRLRRQQEEAEAKGDITDRQHQQKEYHSYASHQTKMTQSAQIATQKQYQTNVSHHTKMAQNDEMTSQKQAAMDRQNAATAAAQRTKMKMAQAQQTQKLNLQHKQHNEDLVFQKKKNRLNEQALATKAHYRK
ncbi:ankyrin repeat containing [Fusarium albosuccineum]|uniref:Ankyrin repeat containing n=1 Tax=Fusarium albosuccineum TaxID=1237068 RepID=A0A8H4L771_9HYPO|nr:ankyrin repeat containing [Fusarium albosuccineum]